MAKDKQTVVVGMSGGVDSSVAALLLKQQGWNVVGLFMKNWEDDDTDEYCSSRVDLIDAAAAADAIGIELDAINFATEYKDRVFSAFLSEYQAGRTPNPDVLCNAEIKFKAFLDHAINLGADYIATGHYAKVQSAGGYYQLFKARDLTKDQSYFLHRLNQNQLSKTLFPLGEITKREVRQMAQEAGLPNHAKKDSTGICFIGERPFRAFLNRYLSYQHGPMETPQGNVVGEHVGLSFYTIGQRKGLGIGGVRNTSEGAWYVVGKDKKNNKLIVAQGHDHPLLKKLELRASDLSWISGTPPAIGASYGAKTRYRQSDAVCQITRIDERSCDVVFQYPQWAITPGQSVVFYEGNICLGGGVIQ